MSTKLLTGAHIEDPNLIDDKFKVLKRLGHGSFSLVYLVENLENNELVALKSLLPKKVQLAPLISDFENERNTLLKLNHRNVIKILDPNIFEGKITQAQKERKIIYIITEFCELGEITQYIKKGFPIKIARFFFKQLIYAVEALHSNNIAHRDIKSPNIVIDKSFNLKLVDFGLSAEIKNSVGEKILFQNIKGSRCSMAPELLSGNSFLLDKNDIFACGIVLFNFLTGKYPFSQAIESDPLYKYIYNNDFSKFWKINKYTTLPKDAKSLFEQMIFKNPEVRIDIEGIKKSDFFNGEVSEISEINKFFQNL